jgi:Uma2 family endonuclease
VDELVIDDGEPMESERHVRQMTLLIESLDEGLERDDFYVGGNMFVYFSEVQARKNDFRGPDVFVVLDTARGERKAWVVWDEEGRMPNIVIELLSESTAHVDRGEKKRIYAQSLRVAEYFLFDPYTKELEGFTLDLLSRQYIPKQPDARGFLRSEQLGLYLGAVSSEPWGRSDSWLRWIDDHGKPLPHSTERLRAQLARANDEAERANHETERANHETERANHEAERANHETERANREAERADELARELQRLRSSQR